MKRIFVTVGSHKFDELIQVIDELALELKNFEIVAQIGRGEYIPKHIKYFKYDPQIKKWYKWADLLISIDSAGTLFENLELGNKIIAVRNWNKVDADDLGKKLAEEGYIIFINVDRKEKLKKELKKVLKERQYKLLPYKKPQCSIHKVITSALGE